MTTFRQIFMSKAFNGKLYGKTGHSESMIFNPLKARDPLKNLLNVIYSILRKIYTHF